MNKLILIFFGCALFFAIGVAEANACKGPVIVEFLVNEKQNDLPLQVYSLMENNKDWRRLEIEDRTVCLPKKYQNNEKVTFLILVSKFRLYLPDIVKKQVFSNWTLTVDDRAPFDSDHIDKEDRCCINWYYAVSFDQSGVVKNQSMADGQLVYKYWHPFN